VREHGTPEPPAARRRAADPGAHHLGRGLDYDYPHDHAEGVSEQELMPDEAIGERFLELSEHGEERDLAERLEKIRKARGRAPSD
jgi:putative ATPase